MVDVTLLTWPMSGEDRVVIRDAIEAVIIGEIMIVQLRDRSFGHPALDASRRGCVCRHEPSRGICDLPYLVRAIGITAR
jgi:hypothetical protein